MSKTVSVKKIGAALVITSRIFVAGWGAFLFRVDATLEPVRKLALGLIWV